VTTGAGLDALVANLRDCCTCEPESGIEPCNWCKVANTLTALRRERDELRADRERLDWLSRATHVCVTGNVIMCHWTGGGTSSRTCGLRDSIDAALTLKEKP
jgi:hypothetical protein